jgi:hypothetical protein
MAQIYCDINEFLALRFDCAFVWLYVYAAVWLAVYIMLYTRAKLCTV